jgi:hypothetical protein
MRLFRDSGARARSPSDCPPPRRASGGRAISSRWWTPLSLGGQEGIPSSPLPRSRTTTGSGKTLALLSSPCSADSIAPESREIPRNPRACSTSTGYRVCFGLRRSSPSHFRHDDAFGPSRICGPSRADVTMPTGARGSRRLARIARRCDDHFAAPSPRLCAPNGRLLELDAISSSSRRANGLGH